MEIYRTTLWRSNTWSLWLYDHGCHLCRGPILITCMIMGVTCVEDGSLHTTCLYVTAEPSVVEDTMFTTDLWITAKFIESLSGVINTAKLFVSDDALLLREMGFSLWYIFANDTFNWDILQLSCFCCSVRQPWTCAKEFWCQIESSRDYLNFTFSSW